MHAHSRNVEVATIQQAIEDQASVAISTDKFQTTSQRTGPDRPDPEQPETNRNESKRTDGAGQEQAWARKASKQASKQANQAKSA